MSPAPEPWRIYLQHFRERAEGVGADTFDRSMHLAEAAHAAYRATADRLTGEEGWDDDVVLSMTRGLNQATKEWIDAGGEDLDRLERTLQERARRAT